MAVDIQVVEQTLLDIIRSLHPFRLRQVIDFARWIQTQPPLDEPLEQESITVLFDSGLEEEDKLWQAAYLENQDEFRAMADEALAEFEAGETMDMVLN